MLGKRTNNNIRYVSGLTTSGKENCKTGGRSLRPAGGLTYCISAGWKRTSNLTLLLPGSRVRRSGNNSFSDCWSGQCPWYWKPTALRVSDPQRQTVQGQLQQLRSHCSMVKLVLLMAVLRGDLSIYRVVLIQGSAWDT